ncbi:hypothetical protein HO173_012999 [Letharia columbiana]|uniref:Uncharacterized protein n=1 Tax=Letharia columbiana TaxID=112416 RepID=A0A8H6FDK5_9LECA|nr:uncharacterized protein HO173_012999 [Letharia columbiana]KAF6224587.1 hypothetical protein HO173_012999 [Letharia columbiana]
MYVHLIRGKSVARVWRFVPCLVVLLVTAVVLGLVWDPFISVLLTVVMRKHQLYAQWDAQTLQEWKCQWKLLFVAPTGLVIAIAIFVFVALERDNTDTAATQNAVDNGSNDDTAAVQNPADSEPNDGTAMVQCAVNNRSNDVDLERDAGDNGDDQETLPVIRRAALGIPVVLEPGNLLQLPEAVLQESPWSTETASDLLAVAGHDWTPDIRSSQRWASTAVWDPAEALNAHSSHSRAVIPAEVLNQTCITGPSHSQGSTTLSGHNQILIARPIHGRSLFPVRYPRCQEVGATLSRASKARSIHDRSPNTSPSSDQKPMALPVFGRAPSFKPSSNPAPIAYQSYNQASDSSSTPDQALNQRSIYNRCSNTPPSFNQDSVALHNPDRDSFAEPDSIHHPTAFQSYGQALNTPPISCYAKLTLPPRSRSMDAIHINPRWEVEGYFDLPEFDAYFDLPPGTPSPEPSRRPDWTRRSTLLSRSGRSIPQISPPASRSPGSPPNPSTSMATPSERNVPSFEDQRASRRAYKQN